ncbi:histidine kinase [Lentzea terrae]|uniref:histidine kinase n=1 Tax=Lentzea terrae TaxID=2200761 RepID=UPI000DD3C5C8|nr:histidine kinase dimerization/phosphoacceptor domain-containing protein [Lentzea terrae]
MREAVARRRVVEERLRIARELHDVVGDHVAVINVHAGLARRALRTDPDLSEHALVETETAARAVLREMAGILRVLRADGDDTAAPGLDRVVIWSRPSAEAVWRSRRDSTTRTYRTWCR